MGLEITGITFLHDVIEIHLRDMVLTGLTKPFGLIDCQGVGPGTLVTLIGNTVDELEVVPGRHVALDSGPHRVGFPIDTDSASGPESVRVSRPVQAELGLPASHWIW